jgi:hypothetical protein
VLQEPRVQLRKRLDGTKEIPTSVPTTREQSRCPAFHPLQVGKAGGKLRRIAYLGGTPAVALSAKRSAFQEDLTVENCRRGSNGNEAPTLEQLIEAAPPAGGVASLIEDMDAAPRAGKRK